MFTSLNQEYAESLAALEGNHFQDEVCVRLQSVILGFQTVPARPQGDAGLDGFSHHGKRGYCCYVPEHDAFRTNRSREAAVAKKFKADLRRLFELDFKSRKLVRSKNSEMATILPTGQKIKHIELIVNWFESHRVLNPILTAVAEYKSVSECTYVDRDASVIVVGPKDLANRYAVDEVTILRARQRVVIKKVQQAAQVIELEEAKDFDYKMTVLREIRPDQLTTIQSLIEQFRASWRMALAFERELDETVPTLHHALEDDRDRIHTRVVQLMLASNEPWTQLARATEVAKEILDQDFRKLYGPLVYDVSSGEIARLIGECSIGWERPSISNG